MSSPRFLLSWDQRRKDEEETKDAQMGQGAGREETKVAEGREEEVESNISSRDQTAGSFLLRRPLTRITVASPATLKRWTSRWGWRQGHLLRRCKRHLYDFAADQSPSAWQLLRDFYVSPGIYVVYFTRKTPSVEPWTLRDCDFTFEKRRENTGRHFRCRRKRVWWDTITSRHFI